MTAELLHDDAVEVGRLQRALLQRALLRAHWESLGLHGSSESTRRRRISDEPPDA